MAFTAPVIRNSKLPVPVFGDEGNITEQDMMTGPNAPFGGSRTIPGVPEPVSMTTDPAVMTSNFSNLGNQQVTTQPVKKSNYDRKRGEAAKKQWAKLMEMGSDTSPVPNWGMGIARMGAGLLGGLEEGRLMQQEREADEASRQNVMDMLAKGGGTSDWAGIMMDPNSSAEAKQLAGAYITAGLTGDKTDDIKEWRTAQRENGYKGSLQDWILSQKKAGAINLGGGTDKQIFDTMNDRWKDANLASKALTAIQNARSSLNGPGGIIAGALGNEQLALRKLGALFGADTSAITNTETFRSAVAPLVAANVKATVGTNNISNTDREFAEKAAGANIVLDETTLRRLLDLNERAQAAIVDQYNQMLERVYPAAGGAGDYSREREIFGGIKRGDTQYELEQEARRRGLIP